MLSQHLAKTNLARLLANEAQKPDDHYDVAARPAEKAAHQVAGDAPAGAIIWTDIGRAPAVGKVGREC